MDLTATKVTVRAHTRPVWYHVAHAQIDSETLIASADLEQDVALHSSECTILRANLLNKSLESFSFQKILKSFAKDPELLTLVLWPGALLDEIHNIWGPRKHSR